MKKLIAHFPLLALLISNPLFAQGGTNYLDVKGSLSNVASLANVGGVGVWGPAKIEDKTITGTNYLFKNFDGIHLIINKAGNGFKVMNLNYNLSSGNLESKISKDSVFQYDLKQVDYVVSGNKNYKNLENDNLNGLVLEVFKGDKLDIYKKIDVSVLEGSINPMTQEKIQQDKYEQSFTYFANINGNLEKIKLNKSAILKLVKDKQTEIKEYAKSNSLDFSNEIDVKIILKHYESL